MSKRNISLLLEDIKEGIDNIEHYTHGFTQNVFEKDRKTIDAVVRNFEIIGEAARALPDSYREVHQEIEWSQIIGLRNRVVHEYFDVDITIIWFIIEKELSPLKRKIEKQLNEETQGGNIT